jgi:hypothetical protein
MSFDKDDQLERDGAYDWAVETWHYMGRRCDRAGKLTDHWQTAAAHDPINPSETEKVFAHDRRQRYVVGSAYALPVQRDDDGVTARFGRAEQTGEVELDETVNAWRLLDRAAMAQQEQFRALQRAIKEAGDIGAMTLEQVREAYWRLLPHQRAGVIAAVIEYLR